MIADPLRSVVTRIAARAVKPALRWWQLSRIFTVPLSQWRYRDEPGIVEYTAEPYKLVCRPSFLGKYVQYVILLNGEEILKGVIEPWDFILMSGSRLAEFIFERISQRVERYETRWVDGPYLLVNGENGEQATP